MYKDKDIDVSTSVVSEDTNIDEFFVLWKEYAKYLDRCAIKIIKKVCGMDLEDDFKKGE